MCNATKFDKAAYVHNPLPLSVYRVPVPVIVGRSWKKEVKENN